MDLVKTLCQTRSDERAPDKFSWAELCQKLEADVPSYKELTSSLKADPNVICLKARLKEEQDPEERQHLVEFCYDLLVSRITGEERLGGLFLESASKVYNPETEAGLLSLEQALSIITIAGPEHSNGEEEEDCSQSGSQSEDEYNSHSEEEDGSQSDDEATTPSSPTEEEEQ